MRMGHAVADPQGSTEFLVRLFRGSGCPTTCGPIKRVRSPTLGDRLPCAFFPCYVVGGNETIARRMHHGLSCWRMHKENCPFCGGYHIDLYQVDTASWSAVCASCGAIGPNAPGEKEALIKWNSASRRNDQSATRPLRDAADPARCR